MPCCYTDNDLSWSVLFAVLDVSDDDESENVVERKKKRGSLQSRKQSSL